MSDFKDLLSVSALLAFVMAFFGLMARERKTPTVINRLYLVSIILFSLLLMVSVSNILIWDDKIKVNDREESSLNLIDKLMPLALPCCYAVVLWGLIMERNRAKYFRVDNCFELTPLGKVYRRFRRKTEASEVKFSPQQLNSILNCSYLDENELKEAFETREKLNGKSISVSAIVQGLPQANKLILELSTTFMKFGGKVFYVTCNRHPIELLEMINAEWDNEFSPWCVSSEQVFVIDGYSPHFGFGESIHELMTKKARALIKPKHLITSKVSFAGIHSSVVKLYQRAKSKQSNFPSLMIYEGCHALIDLESSEQYRLFVRHVMPSERLWGGMMTLFVETLVTSDNLAILEEVSDVFVNLKDDKGDCK